MLISDLATVVTMVDTVCLALLCLPQKGPKTIFYTYTAHFVLLDPNCTIKKIVCSALPLILMNPMHHPVKMAKNHGFLPRGVETKPKTLFQSAISWMCHFGPM